MSRPWTLVGAVLGGLAVAAGAFGAHALKDRLSEQALGWWQTAAHYHLVHALALVVIGAMTERSVGAGSTAGVASRALSTAGWAFAGGIALFSGSLYALALSDARWLGAVTPLGGLALLVGWAALAVAAWRGRRQGA